MHRVLRPLKDTYITDKVTKTTRRTSANVGKAATIDLFKLYGVTQTAGNPNNELSRGLIKFDLSELKRDVAAGLIDTSSPTFQVKLKLVDVYGGQPNPTNFTLKVNPLSRSFDEGLGKDIVFFQDTDVSNFLTASYANGASNVWFASGANAKGVLGASNIDIIETGNLQDGLGVTNLFVTQSFVHGTENLDVDVTRIVSATLAGLIPDHGFRLAFQDSEENDQQTRFVKRFGSSEASDPYVRPSLVFGYDDSVISNESNFTFDSPNTLFLYNYVRGNLANAVSGTSLTPVTGPNSLLLKLVTRVSGVSGFSNFITYVTASQHTIGSIPVTGVYKATFTLASGQTQFQTKLRQSGSITFDQVWGSFDGSVAYYSGTLEVNPPAAATGPTNPRRYYVNVTNVTTEYADSDVARLKVFFFDFTTPSIKLTNVPLETPSVSIQNAYYSVRDVITNAVAIPFDTAKGSTKLSGDSQTMYFDLWMSSLIPGRAYVVDIMVVEGGQTQIYRDVCPAFRVVQM
jgi:hypothetical protein